jgi:hypothetical protein
MNNLLFLLGAFLLAAVGIVVLVVRAREPRGLDHGVREFQREMRALAPESRRTAVDERGYAPGTRRFDRPEKE